MKSYLERKLVPLPLSNKVKNNATGNKNSHLSFSFSFLPSYTRRLGVTHLMIIIRTFK